MNDFTFNIDVQDEWAGLMKEGYDFSQDGNSLGAILIWGQLWDKMLHLLDHVEGLSLEKLDHAFQGPQSIYNWSSDYEMELGSASREESSFAHTRMQFCSQYMARCEDLSDLSIEPMKWAISESYFDLGQSEQGENAFREQLTKSPLSGWGWIRWADHYGVLAKEHRKNSAKAMQILEQALDIEGLKDRYYVLERLEDLYVELGLDQKASAVKQEMLELLVDEGQDFKPLTTTPPAEKIVPIAKHKVGRNDPCPCGSNKKYKKCCGSNAE